MPSLPSLSLLSTLALGAFALAQSPEFEVTFLGYDTNVYPNGLTPYSARRADFDGDGTPDVAVSSWYKNPQLSIILADGRGGFAPPLTHDLLDASRDLEVGDFDNDGDIDIVVNDTGQLWDGFTFELWANDGAAGFTRVGAFPCGQGPNGITAGDFNGDGWLDVAVAHDRYIVSTNTIAVVLNDGSGGFLPPRILTTGVSATHKIAAGDLDGNGLDDLVVAHEGSVISVFYSGAAGFAEPQRHQSVGSLGVPQLAFARIADADSDGDLDVLFSHTGMGGGLGSLGAISLFRNDGTGGLAPVERIDLVLDGGSTGFDLADVTGDGVTDIVAAAPYSQWAMVAGDGAGGFLPAEAYGAGQGVITALAIDVDSDGDVDPVAIAGSSLEICVFDNPGNGVFSRLAVVDLVNPGLVPVSFSNLAAADVDRDGDLDFAVGYSANFAGIYGLSVRRNRGDGTFAPPDDYREPVFSKHVVLADLNGDGWLDLVASGSNPFPGNPRLRYRLNRGDGTFGAARVGPGYGGAQGEVEVVDANGDGRNDVLIASTNLYTMLNTGEGFAAPLVHALTTGASAIESGDFDGDGDADVATNTAIQGYIEISLGRGDGTWNPPFLAQSGRGVGAIQAHDLDGDGVLDLAAAYGSDGQGVSVLLGRGDGSFRPPTSYHGSYGTSIADNVTVADVDRDGDPDLLVANSGSSDVSFWRNQGNATYARQIRWGAAYGAPLGLQGASAVVWAEVTGDGIRDLAVLADPNSHRRAYYYPAVVVLPGRLETWVGEGGAVAGALGVPLLEGVGTLQPGTRASLTLTRAGVGLAGVHVLGSTRIDLPLAGGTLIPSPNVVVPFTTSRSSSASLGWTWPATAPPGTRVYVQSWLLDPGAASGLAATQGWTATQP